MKYFSELVKLDQLKTTRSFFNSLPMVGNYDFEAIELIIFAFNPSLKYDYTGMIWVCETPDIWFNLCSKIYETIKIS